MSYFILTDDENIASLKGICYILPKNLITCYLQNSLFEKNIIEWSKQFCSLEKNILDIGAHTGTYALSLAKHCKHVHAFEPQKMTYYALYGSVALSNLENVTCHNFGLGSFDQVGEKTLNIVSVDGGGSSLHVGNDKILRTEKINISTLDSLFLTDISFIKMDVEDNEYFVLMGGLETLKKNNYPKILFECNDVRKNERLFGLLSKFYNIIKISGSSNMYLADDKGLS